MTDYTKNRKASIASVLLATYGSMLRPLSKGRKVINAPQSLKQKRERKRLKRLNDQGSDTPT
jgi:hypothetical protein